MAARPYLTPPHTRAGCGPPPRALSGRRGAGLQNSHRCEVTHTHAHSHAHTDTVLSHDGMPTSVNQLPPMVRLRGAREAAYRHS